MALGLVVLMGFGAFPRDAVAAGSQSSATLALMGDSSSSPMGNDIPSATSAPALSGADDISYLEFDPVTAERLGHSDLTSATLTRSRLTSAHLFTSFTR